MAFATKTVVPPAKTRNDIEALLKRYGANRFGYIDEPGHATVAFEMGGRHYAFRLPIPDPGGYSFQKTEQGKQRTALAAAVKWQQAVRSRWRGLLLIIKAKLEAVEAGVVSIEDEFLAQTVMPEGGTVSDVIQPRLKEIYSGRRELPLLPAPPKEAIT
jgi:hypothetical protein